jgi:hypothetical protein
LVQKFELLDEEAVKSLLTDKEIEIPEGTEGKEALVNIAIQTGIFPEDA